MPQQITEGFIVRWSAFILGTGLLVAAIGIGITAIAMMPSSPRCAEWAPPEEYVGACIRGGKIPTVFPCKRTRHDCVRWEN